MTCKVRPGKAWKHLEVRVTKSQRCPEGSGKSEADEVQREKPRGKVQFSLDSRCGNEKTDLSGEAILMKSQIETKNKVLGAGGTVFLLQRGRGLGG